MSTVTAPSQGSQSDGSALTGPLLVATRGDVTSDGAMRAAMALASMHHAEVHVLAVLEPLPIVAPEYGVLIPIPETEDERERALRANVGDQLQRIVGSGAGWHVDVCRGDPVTMITRTASTEQAGAIVLGLGHHQLLDRLFGSETALHVLRAADTPVLAVPPRHLALPRRAVVAVDFSNASRHAAIEMLRLFEGLTTIHLVHVTPRVDSAAEIVARWEGEYARGLEAAFLKFRALLSIPEHVHVEEVALRGEPAKELLRHAEKVDADLVVSGTHGHGFLERMLIGSVATGLLRGATTALFVVPEPANVRRARSIGQGHTMSSSDPKRWPELLDEFTRRNTGHRSMLELDDPDLGAQPQQVNYPFLGAAYDAHDRRLEIMLGDAYPDGRHLSRSIGNVRELDILRDEAGHDRVLRIVHGRGHTLLTLLRETSAVG